MTKKDFELIAGACAAVEQLNEDIPDEAGIGAATLRLVVDELAGRLEATHPRFNRARFEMACTPISHARQAQVIKDAMARDRT